MYEVFSKTLGEVMIYKNVRNLLERSGYRFIVSESADEVIIILSIINSKNETEYEIIKTPYYMVVLDRNRAKYVKYAEILTKRVSNDKWAPYIDAY